MVRVKVWNLASKQHPLGRLQGKGLNPYELVVLTGTKNRFGADYFKVFLKNTSGKISRKPVILGLFNRRRYPGYTGLRLSALRHKSALARKHKFMKSLLMGWFSSYFSTWLNSFHRAVTLWLNTISPAQQDTAHSLAPGLPPIHYTPRVHAALNHEITSRRLQAESSLGK